MNTLQGYGEVVMMMVLLSLYVPVITSLVLARVILSTPASLAKKTLYYLISIPVLYLLMALWVRQQPFGNSNGLFVFGVLMTVLYGYLRITAFYNSPRRKRLRS